MDANMQRLPVLFRAALLALVLASTSRAMAEPLQAKHAQVELISQSSAAKAGTEFMLGVHFVLESGWHIYWINPGDSGQPPVFKWQLPPGFSAGDIQWPRPERLQSSTQIVDYGYHGEVLLMTPLRVADRLSSGASAQITVDAKWLICREVCLPDHAQLHLSLPLSSASQNNGDAAPLFGNAAKLLPKPLPAGWAASAVSSKDSFVLTIRTAKPFSKAEFFPLDPGQVENAAPQRVEETSRGARITLKKSDLLTKPISVLRGVLVLSNGDAYDLEARVTPGTE
jgi:thiol:disulfide interchange protein DsbD